MSDATILFRDALQSVYGLLDWLPVSDGGIHRRDMSATPKLCSKKSLLVERQEQKGLANE